MSLKHQCHRRMPSNGRMNLCGINTGNIKYFADTLASVVNDAHTKF